MNSNHTDTVSMANQMRQLCLKAISRAGSGHPGGSLSLADLLAVLYFGGYLNIRPEDPRFKDRDRVVLSKGHACPILYSALALKGFISVDDLMTLRQSTSFLQGHPDMKHTPGIDMSTGSLGQGISAACGIALGLKRQGIKAHVWAFLGDGELDEGEVWEALSFASAYGLSNLTVVLDWNGLQIDGSNKEVMNLGNVKERFEVCGLECVEIDGHDHEAIAAAYDRALSCHTSPFGIIARTVKGKGVSFMENQVGWHGKAPDAQCLEKALCELGGRL